MPYNDREVCTNANLFQLQLLPYDDARIFNAVTREGERERDEDFSGFAHNFSKNHTSNIWMGHHQNKKQQKTSKKQSTKFVDGEIFRWACIKKPTFDL
jgi:hypothetical protein